MSQSFRLATTYQFTPPAIDRKAGILRGITAMQAGIEALGHGVQADMTTLQTLALMGNADVDGVRSRFGHPGISENATGKKVANATNFQVKGDRLIHDSRLLESARKSPVFSQDPIEYIIEMAEKTPRELGESVVIAANTVWALTDGREIDVEVWGPGRYTYPNGKPTNVDFDDDGRPVNATTPLPVLRPVAFHFVDFVGEPALVRDGLTPMSADAINYLFAGRASEYAQEMFRIVDEWRSRYHVPLQAIPGKVDQIVSEYMAARSGRSTDMARKLKFEDVEVEPVTPPAESDPVEDDISAAEQTTADTQDDLTETEAQMDSRIANLEATVSGLLEQNKRLAALVRQNAEMTQTLQRNIKRLAGEPVVTERVPKSKQQPMEDLQTNSMDFGHPTPRYQMEAPAYHATERRPDSNGVLPTDSPRVAAAKRNMARANIVRGSGGGQ